MARSSQEQDENSTLNFYKSALKLRGELALGEGSFDWVGQDDVLSYLNGNVLVAHNFSNETHDLPAGELLLSSASREKLLPNQTVWVRQPSLS